MANVLFATRKALTDTMSTVSATTSGVATTANALSNYAGMLEAHARDSRETYVRSLAEGQTQRVLRRLNTRALDDAHFYQDLNKELADDPELFKLHAQALSAYTASDDKALAKLNSVP